LSAGSLDPAFGHDSTVNLGAGYTARAVVSEGDGKILVLRQVWAAGFDIARLNSDGSLDTSFGTNGTVTGTWGYDTTVVNMAVLSDGSILVGGWHFADAPSSAWSMDWYADVSKYKPDGTPDTTFGNGGLAEVLLGETPLLVSLGMVGEQPSFPAVTDMAVDGNNNIVLAGSSPSPWLMRLTPSGT